jgi:hypothetical protein
MFFSKESKMISKILSLTRKPLAMALAVVVAAVFASGCAGQKLGKQTVVVKYYPECYRPINDLREAAKKVNQATAAGAIFGAITGAAVAYAESGGNKASIAKGAIAGGLSGAGLGYLISSEVQAMDQVQRFQTYAQAMDMDLGNMKQAVAAAKITNACYDKQYKALVKNVKSGRIPPEEMSERLQEIRDGSNDAYTVLRNYSDGASQTAQTYDQVIAMERERPDRATPQRIRAVTQKKAAFDQQVKSSTSMTAQLEKNLQRYNDSTDIINY